MSQPTRTRSIALVGAMAAERLTTQTGGYPLDPAKMLPLADVVLVVADDDGGAMLFRYTAHGELGGDTWHATVAEAQEQAAQEYGDALIPWVDVPSDITDAHAFAVQYAYERLNSRGGW
ncbi:MAG TPA: hypothetical protein VNA89_05110 [Gemmatimonadaceae bacterium]|nr:hypothetical protein [Gemmatimonadaceae bacterium]